MLTDYPENHPTPGARRTVLVGHASCLRFDFPLRTQQVQGAMLRYSVEWQRDTRGLVGEENSAKDRRQSGWLVRIGSVLAPYRLRGSVESSDANPRGV